jgi:hypothetical protein
MENKFENRHSDNPNSLTTDDKQVLDKKSITPTDVKDALSGREANKAAVSGMRTPEIGFKLILGILLILSGIMIAVITSITLIGIVFGAVLVIAGIVLLFSDFGKVRANG